MKDLGEFHHFLGLEVENVKDVILISQEGYAKKIIDRFGLKESRRCFTCLDANMKIRYEEGSLLQIFNFIVHLLEASCI